MFLKAKTREILELYRMNVDPKLFQFLFFPDFFVWCQVNIIFMPCFFHSYRTFWNMCVFSTHRSLWGKIPWGCKLLISGEWTTTWFTTGFADRHVRTLFLLNSIHETYGSYDCYMGVLHSIERAFLKFINDLYHFVRTSSPTNAI